MPVVEMVGVPGFQPLPSFDHEGAVWGQEVFQANGETGEPLGIFSRR